MSFLLFVFVWFVVFQIKIETVKILIRHCINQCLVWACTVCLCLIKRTIDLYGLKETLISCIKTSCTYSPCCPSHPQQTGICGHLDPTEPWCLPSADGISPWFLHIGSLPPLLQQSWIMFPNGCMVNIGRLIPL